MKKLQQWFNTLRPKQQKLVLAIFCLIFSVLLTLSIRYQQLTLNTGNILQPRIKTASLKQQ